MSDRKINLSERTDISKFLVHLTRDSNEYSAKENLINILNSQKIEARNYHCLFKKLLDKENSDVQKKFCVTCYTETPLDKLKYLTQKIENRDKEFKPYGIIFLKCGLKDYEECGMKYLANYQNPVFYAIGENRPLIRTLFKEFEQYVDDYKNGKTNDFNLIGALINIVNDKHNFQWEREWRTVGDYEFIIPDIVAVIAPSAEHNEIRDNIKYYFADAITFIDVNWNMEQILLNIGSQSWNNWHKYYNSINPVLGE